jgi:tetratricopeptide (TPR) repeat protein
MWPFFEFGIAEWHHKALAIREKALGEEHPDTAETYNNIALVYSRQDDYPRALEWYYKALAIQEKALGKEHPRTTIIYNNIAEVYSRQGDYSRALERHQNRFARIA